MQRDSENECERAKHLLVLQMKKECDEMVKSYAGRSENSKDKEGR